MKAYVLLHSVTDRNIIMIFLSSVKLYGLKCILAVTEVIIRVSGKIALAVYLIAMHACVKRKLRKTHIKDVDKY